MAQILVIDDDQQVRDVIAGVLRNAGHEIIEASNGAEGLATFRTQHPMLVITDVLMPEKEGVETIRELRGEAPDIPIIAISGAPHRLLYLRAASALGADVSLAKPFRWDELVSAVAELLKTRVVGPRK